MAKHACGWVRVWKTAVWAESTTGVARAGRRACGALVLALAGLAPAVAETFPNRALTLVVPAAAGSATDILARLFAEGMARDLQQPVVVENLPGAGGTIGQRKVARAEADGYTLVIGNVGLLAATPWLHKDLPYDALKDFTPIASIADSPTVLSVKKDLPVNDLGQFADYIKRHASDVYYGTAGAGTSTHLGAVLVNQAIGAKVEAVHYRGAGQAIADVMAGHIDYMVESSATAVASAASGRLKPLAVLRKERIAVLPDVPAAGEAGFVDLSFDIWNMLLVPGGTPPERVERLNASVNRQLDNPAVREQLQQLGMTLPGTEQRSVEGAARLLTDETTKWQQILVAAGLAV